MSHDPLDSDPVEPEADFYQHSFRVTGISRADLRDELGFSDEEIAQLDDAAMYRIAERLEDYFVETGFWEGLRVYARHELGQAQDNQYPDPRKSETDAPPGR